MMLLLLVAVLVFSVVALAAVVALPTVILAFMYGQSRIFFVMSRDGLLPPALSRVNARTGTPVIMNLTDMDDSDAKRLVDFSASMK